MTTTFGLDLGPLQNNGGPTATDGELANSVARNNGSTTLTNGIPLGTDQRGTGFPRENSIGSPTTVDVGAFELLPPVITSFVNQNTGGNSAFEGESDITLIINGSGFQAGATVTFGSTNALLTPIAGSVTSTQLMVTVTQALIHTNATALGFAVVTVNNPDASGTGATTIPSPPADFPITPPVSVPVNPVSDQTNNEKDVLSSSAMPSTAVTVTSTDPYATNFTDEASGSSVHTLPPGLSIDPNTGVITGTINPYDGDASPYVVTIYATDDGVTGSTTFNWNVNRTSPPTLTAPSPAPSNSTGTSLSLSITNMDGSAFNDLTSTSKHTLPPGLSINSSTGVITGTPTKVGTYSVIINATRNGGTGSKDTAQISFTWTITDPNAPSIQNPGPQTATAATAITNIQLVFKNITSFSANGTLPPGLTVSNTGVISGTPFKTDDKNYIVTITGTGSDGSTSVSFAYTINGGTGMNAGPGTPVPVDTVVLMTNGSLVEYIPSANPGVFSTVGLSGPGTIKAISTVLDGSGNTDVFAIGTTYNPSTNPINTPIGVGGAQYNNNLWEYIFGSWHRQSSGSFQQISATTNSGGETIVFGLVTGGSLWEQTHSFGVDTGWSELSGDGSAGYISAVTDSAGVDHVFVVTSASFSAAPLTLWEHLPSTSGNGWAARTRPASFPQSARG